MSESCGNMNSNLIIVNQMYIIYSFSLQFESIWAGLGNTETGVIQISRNRHDQHWSFNMRISSLFIKLCQSKEQSHLAMIKIEKLNAEIQQPLIWGTCSALQKKILPIPWSVDKVTVCHITFTITSPVLRSKSNKKNNIFSYT